jgi:cobalt-precorrin 5A hydrolase
MKITLIAFTKKGADICYKLTTCLSNEGHDTEGFSKYNCHDLNLLETNIYDFTEKVFKKDHAIVYIGAVGIAVRAIAPFVISKAKDPAVIVVDEAGEYVIPILSGHIGGANELAFKIAELINGRPVITTATDINNVFSVDVWAKKNDLYIENIENIKHISAALLDEQRVGFCSDFPVEGEIPNFLKWEKADTGIYIYNSLERKEHHHCTKMLLLTPKRFVVGIGCRKGIEEDIFEEVFFKILSGQNILPCLVKCIATIDIKKEEKAIISLCEKYGYRLKTYSRDELLSANGNFTSSEFVRSITGVENVCERAAFLASDKGELILRKTINNGITIAAAARSWRCRF